MAGPYYVRSTDGDDADSGLTWALAKKTLVGALAVAAAGERIWVSQAHAETQASAMTLTSAGTAAAPVEILCGNDGAEPPTALATTATSSTTGANSLAFGAGVAFVYGITFSCGTGAGAANLQMITTSSAWHLESCQLSLATTAVGQQLTIGGGSGQQLACRFRNVTVSFANAGHLIRIRNAFVWAGGSLVGTSPTVLFSPVTGAAMSSPVRVIGVDLSNCTGTLVNVAGGPVVVSFEQCKLGSGVALVTGTNPGPWGTQVYLANCDSADTQYRMQRHQYEGDVYSDTAVYRTGGASDGTTPLSHKMVSSANSKFTFPLYGPEFVIYNAATGSAKTATVEIVRDIAATNLNDDEVWLETEYLGTSGVPLSLFASDRMTNILSTPAAQDASTAGWTLGGFGTAGTKQKLVTTFTPQEVGIIRCRVALAKATTTIYVDPLITVA